MKNTHVVVDVASLTCAFKCSFFFIIFLVFGEQFLWYVFLNDVEVSNFFFFFNILFEMIINTIKMCTKLKLISCYKPNSTNSKLKNYINLNQEKNIDS